MKKQLVIIGIVALLICVGLSGCDQTSSNNQPHLTSEIKTITISGMNTIQTVDYTEHPIKLIVTGMNCDITVAKDTNLTEVILSGMNSIVRVSHSHKFTSTVSGLNAKIVYYVD